MESSYLTLRVVNAFLSSIASILNILTIYAIRKTPSLAKNLKILLLSLAVSHLGISLLAQPMYVAQLTMQWKYRNESYNAIYIADLIPTNIFITATLFSVMALCAERFLAIQLHLRYQELVIYKRVIIAVISIWVFSTLTSLLKLWIPKNIMFVFSVIKDSSSIITATFLSIKLYPTLRRHKQFNLRDMPAFSSYTNYTKLKRAFVWCVLPLKLFHLFSPTKYYLVLKISQISWLSKKQELFLTLILGIVNYQLEVATATPKTARH